MTPAGCCLINLKLTTLQRAVIWIFFFFGTRFPYLSYKDAFLISTSHKSWGTRSCAQERHTINIAQVFSLKSRIHLVMCFVSHIQAMPWCPGNFIAFISSKASFNCGVFFSNYYRWGREFWQRGMFSCGREGGRAEERKAFQSSPKARVLSYYSQATSI